MSSRLDQIADEALHPLPARVVDVELAAMATEARTNTPHNTPRKPDSASPGPSTAAHGATYLGDVPATWGKHEPAWPPCASCGKEVEWSDETMCERCQEEAEHYDPADDVPTRGW